MRLSELEPGDEIAFRGPTGRSMVPHDDDRELHLLATATGVAPFYSLAVTSSTAGTPGVVLWWGLRLAADICLTGELDALAAEYPHFSYHLTRSSPLRRPRVRPHERLAHQLGSGIFRYPDDVAGEPR